MQCYCVVVYDKDWLTYMWFEKEGVPQAYKALLSVLASCVLINVILNFCWSWLIVKELIKTVKGGFEADVDDSETNAEKSVKAGK